ncbi:MAG: RnfABCDGE type electron transport complex subunit B [Gammaproteobacteria bacterium SHHR-1]|nr:RnfABCDGE type electron transport complex subunit B [gamma proteobacterium SS-5]
MLVLGGLLAYVLVVANRKLWVYEDPRIELVEDLLPHSNCGACGTPGCRPFAEALIDGQVQPSQCTVNSAEQNLRIADFLGVDAGESERLVARLACSGGNNVARMRAHYAGLESCRAAAAVGDGPKGCSWGCLGMGDCADVCDFDAIHLNAQDIPVVDAAKCTACNDCVEICPKDLFSLQPAANRLWINCRNLQFGDAAEADCEVACTACERCVMDSPEGLIRIDNNLAVIDYSKNALASKVATERCPTGAIVWLDERAGVIKGREAKPIIRQTALPAA